MSRSRLHRKGEAVPITLSTKPKPHFALLVFYPLGLLAPSIALAFLLTACHLAPSVTIQGIVMDENGPLAGATVRIQGTENASQSDAEGRFLLEGVAEGTAVVVSAWSDGYYCAKSEPITPPASKVILSLHPYQTEDNPAYTWISPVGEDSCYSCKAGITQVWLENDAHAGAASNPRFLTMYYGTDVSGNQSPLTQFGSSPDYGSFPLPVLPGTPYYGPGYKLDYPDSAGNCAACHLPGMAVDDPYGADPNTASGADAYGIHCDFCHKVAAVKLDPQSGLPYPNMPGVLSMDIRRPFTDDPLHFQLFFGTFDDDNVPEEDTYLPLIEQSAFCAPCHYGVFWDTVVYNSYGEWLASPYNDPVNGKTCQQCHMPAPTLLNGEEISNVAPGKGGIERDPSTIHAHTFPGASNEELLQNAVTMDASAREESGLVLVSVSITNDQTGHHVPTDSPLRQLILLVQATDAMGQPLTLLEGPLVPEWGGIGDRESGHYAGLPGTGYARILEEAWTYVSPSGAYWNPTRVVSDNRLPAFASDTTAYTFAGAEGGGYQIDITLFFRRAPITLMEQKGWAVADIVMETKTLNGR
ncbi:MAG: carboxypeptidase regulatory-like domain-containing protein [Anaerolineales bacterium]|nr:carboxypeptidase regulatory-like domain-containing protein [Anaerolineales bacterium]